MIHYQSNPNSGFSLIETLVAISILLIVIVGPMTITARTAKSSTFATEQAQAFFLAQEGIELAQKLRDDLMLGYFNTTPNPSNPWARFVDNSNSGTYRNCYDSTGCGLWWSNNTDVGVTSASCGDVNNSNSPCRLYQKNSGRDYFTHVSTNNTITPFTRRVKFIRDGSTEKIIVKSEVTWRTGSIVAIQRVELETYLYNVYGAP